MMSLCRSVILAVAAILPAVGIAPAQAQDYPNQTIKLLITNPPGGLPDTVARLYGRILETRLGQSIVIENRPGANGSVAVGAMLGAPANGYTLIVTDGGIYSANPALFSNLSYSEKDLKPMAILARAPLFLAVHPKVPVNTLAEFIAYAKANPGKLNYGSSGIGSVHHFSVVAMNSALKLEMVHVPFKGTGESVPALLGGHIDVLFSAFPSLSGAADTKQVKLLAANSAVRSSLAPNLPSIAELIPDYDYAPIIGIYGRTGTPEAAVQKIANTVIEIAKDPELISKLAIVGVEALGAGAAQHEAALQAESKRSRALIEANGLKAK